MVAATPFEFATAGRILFGEGKVREVPAAAAAMGRRPLVVTGASAERAAALIAGLRAAGLSPVSFAVTGEPTVEAIQTGTEFARGESCDLVIALGGGSPIDAGKALAAMLTNPGEPLDYLEVIGRGQPLLRTPAPFIAIPTTAGTGSEVTRNAVLASPAHHVKASLRGAALLPRLAVVDPELTLDLPRTVTASTGLDALTQLVEPYVSARANPMTDLFCREGIRRVAGALGRVWDDGQNREARAAMSWASLLGGLALANAALGAVHGLAAPVGGGFPVPHGAVCAALLPHATEGNVRALRARAPGSPALARYEEVGQLLTGRSQATAEDGIRWIVEICRKLEIQALGAYGVTPADVPPVVEKAYKSNSMKGNPILLTEAELGEILLRAI